MPRAASSVCRARAVEIGNPLQDQREQLRLRDEVNECLLEAPHIPGGLEDVAVQCHDGVGTAIGIHLIDLLRERLVVEPVRLRPDVTLHIVDALGGGERIVLNL